MCVYCQTVHWGIVKLTVTGVNYNTWSIFNYLTVPVLDDSSYSDGLKVVCVSQVENRVK